MYSDSHEGMSQSEKHLILAGMQLDEVDFGIDSLESRIQSFEIEAQTLLQGLIERNLADLQDS